MEHPAGVLDVRRLNSQAWRQAVFGVNLHASASAVGEFYARLTDPEGPVARLLGADLHREYLTIQVQGHDAYVGREVGWTLGFNGTRPR